MSKFLIVAIAFVVLMAVGTAIEAGILFLLLPWLFGLFGKIITLTYMQCVGISIVLTFVRFLFHKSSN